VIWADVAERDGTTSRDANQPHAFMTGLLDRFAAKVAGWLGYARPTFESNPEAEAAAVEAAHPWLALVDDRQYEASWQQAAAQFRNAAPQEDWVQKSSRVRDPMGAVHEREVRQARYATSLPGAPEGEYVVVQFNTRFENKEHAVETVSCVKEDGNWRATGYYIR
jgi:hypothetical protein